MRIKPVLLLLLATPAFAQPAQPQAMNGHGACSNCSLLGDPPQGAYLNRVRLLGGVGPDGMTLDDRNPGSVRVQPFYGPIFGVGYDRVVSSRLSLTVEALTGASTGSKTYIAVGGIGFDF